MSSDENGIGILGSLTDFSFSSFMTIKLIKAIYAIGFVLAAILGIGSILGALSDSFFGGVASLIVVPVIFVLWVMYLRVILELIAVIFRIAEDVRSLARDQGEEPSPIP